MNELCRPNHRDQIKDLDLKDALIMSFDLETTGVNPQEARIVQIGVSYFYQGAPLQRRQELVNPLIPIPSGASDVHHITDDLVQNKPPFSAIMTRLKPHFFGEVFPQLPPPLITGYNIASYDLPLFEAELKRSHADWSLKDAPFIDLYSIVKWHLRHLPNRKLTTVCEYFGIKLDRAHHALADAHASGQLMGALIASGHLPPQVSAAITYAQDVERRTEKEYQEFKHWLYHDRQSGELLLGTQKKMGTPLKSVDPGYVEFILNKVEDLPPKVRSIFEQVVQGTYT